MKSFHLEKNHKLTFVCLFTTAPLLLSGCRGAPSINVVGSFFPAWMLCIALGVAGALGLRLVFTKIGIEPYLWPRPLIYFCLWAMITLALWLLFFRS